MNAVEGKPHWLRARLYPLKRALVGAFNRVTGNQPAPRHENPYCTHVPVLVGLARILDPQCIVEFGCGLYSTPLFLDRRAFSGVRQLISFENDPSWAAQVRDTVNDPRLQLNVVGGDMHVAAATAALDGADCIFIDDSTTADQRARTIHVVRRRALPTVVVVVHDAEVPQYAAETKAFPKRYIFDALTPQTGVLWSARDMPVDALRRVNGIIKERQRDIAPMDVEGWVKAFAPRTDRRVDQHQGKQNDQ
jgi:predicted O-methyltransferase YrrM